MWILVLTCSYSAWAQNATVNQNVVLHRDPTAKSKALEHLIEGDRLTLVDATSDSGFYHVRTEDDQVGWVSSKYITVSEASTPPAPETPSLPTDICRGPARSFMRCLPRAPNSYSTRAGAIARWPAEKQSVSLIHFHGPDKTIWPFTRAAMHFSLDTLE
jgi:uncharacterized protein YgiM (DUF1202 family)